MDELTLFEIKERLVNPEAPPLSLSELQEYREIFHGLLEKEPQNITHYQDITKILITMRRHSEALKILKQGAQHVEKKHVLLASVGAVHSDLQKWPDAVKAYREALVEEPDNLAWLYRLAHAEASQGHHEVSREAIARILRLEKEGGPRFKRRDILFYISMINNSDIQIMTELGLKKSSVAHYILTRKLKTMESEGAARSRQLRRFYGKLSDRIEEEPPSPQALFQTFNFPSGHVFYKNAFYNADLNWEHVRIINGRRLTVGQPHTVGRSIYVCGSSSVFGTGCVDSHTVASFLQKRCNHDIKDMTTVVNFGVTGTSVDNTLLQVMNTDFKKKDMVISLLNWHEIRYCGVEELTHYTTAINRFCLEHGAEYFVAFLPRIDTMNHLSEYDRKLRALEALYRLFPVTEEYCAQILNHLVANGVKAFDLQPLIQGEVSGDLFLDSTHYTPNGNKAIADAVFSLVAAKRTETNLGKTPAIRLALEKTAMVVRQKYAEQDDMKAWLSAAKSAAPRVPGPYGAIVMNCNPFTNGHLHLIREALKQTEGLYIFVVEEDASQFSFQARFQMVKAGTKEFGGRVSILPSGRFVISSFSFSGYFAKEESLSDSNKDSSLDVAIFGAVIAPALGINRRFIGEEPFCQVTALYNKNMLFLLPPLGVEVSVSERRRLGDQVISASAVRSALKHGQTDMVQDMVPPSTWDYLCATLAP